MSIRAWFSSDECRALLPWLVGGAFVILVCAGVFVLIVGGKTRRAPLAPTVPAPNVSTATTTTLVSRRLDGEFVAPAEAELAPWAVMIDQHVEARPASGVSLARVVIEAPVEGGITRLLALFAPTSTLSEVGPIRSARPYFVDWADGWRATYIHVGGSPESLSHIRALGERLHNLNEMSADGWVFWRSAARSAPHSVVTNGALLSTLLARKGFASSTMPVAWHFLEAATGTQLGSVTRIAVPYGGSHNVVWRFDFARGVYARSVAGSKVLDRDSSPIEVNNVIVIKTEAQVLDEQGRLRLRTTGSGEALAYRDGHKYIIRWRRSPGEPIRFEAIDGVEHVLRPGKTWIQATTDDRVFAGVEG